MSITYCSEITSVLSADLDLWISQPTRKRIYQDIDQSDGFFYRRQVWAII